MVASGGSSPNGGESRPSSRWADARRRLWAIAALSVSGVAVAAAQGVRLSGVMRADRGGPIGEVEILVQRSGLRTTSRADGRFELPGLPPGITVLVFRKIGFRPQALTVAVDTVDRALGVVVLEPGAFQLPELSVTARYAKPARYANTIKYDDFYRRRRMGGGVFLDRDALDRRFYAHTHEMLQGLPGVRVELGIPGNGSKLWFSRCNESPPAIAVFVDGVRLIPPWGVSKGYGFDPDRRRRTADRGTDAPVDSRVDFVEMVLNSVSPADIEAMEVFKGPGQLPAEFNLGDNCGAIAIWTRQGGFRAEVDTALPRRRRR